MYVFDKRHSFQPQTHINYRSKLLKQSIFNLKTYIRLQKRYLEESVHVLLSLKRVIFEGNTQRPVQPHICYINNF